MMNPLAYISRERLLEAADIVAQLDESGIDLLNDSVTETLRALAQDYCDCSTRVPAVPWGRNLYHDAACPLDGEPS